MSSETKTSAAETTSAAESAIDKPAQSTVFSLKNIIKAIVIICIIGIIYYIYKQVDKFFGGGVGKAIKDAFGILGGLLAWVAGLPSWLIALSIIGGIGLYLFGPAIFKSMDNHSIKELGEKARELNKELEKSVEAGKITKEEADQIGELVGSKYIKEGIEDTVARGGSNPAADAQIKNMQDRLTKLEADMDAQPRVKEESDEIERRVDERVEHPVEPVP